MKRVLVTGGTGLIGRHALSALIRRGWEPHVLARRPPLMERARVEPVEWCQGDLFDPSSVASVIEKVQPEALLHLAWTTEHGRFWNCSENLLWVNATLNLLKEFANCGGRRFVGAGTCAEYSWASGGVLAESSDRLPHTLYGQCKKSVSEIAEHFCRLSEMEFAWGRVFLLYGLGEDPRRLVPSIAQPLINGGEAVCQSGNLVRDFLHVSDVADAFGALVDGKIQGAVNIGSGQAVSLELVAREIAAACDSEDRLRVGTREASPANPFILVPDTNRLQSELGWSPRIELREGIRQMVRQMQDPPDAAAA